MVENNEFNKGRRRYNNRRSGSGYRRGGSSNVSVGSKSLLNFLFSVNGKISKNLFIGFSLLFALLTTLLTVVSIFVSKSSESSGIASAVLTVLLFVFVFLNIILGYKRAHALGISGIYSIFGIVCLPFFCFNRSDRDFANDNVYKPRFNVFKKVGAFVNKNVFTQIAFLVVFFVLDFAPWLCQPDFNDRDAVIDSVWNFGFCVGALVVFNLLQMMLLKVRWFRHHYVGFVKTATFVAYNVVIMLIASGVTLLLLMSSLMK